MSETYVHFAAAVVVDFFFALLKLLFCTTAQKQYTHTERERKTEIYSPKCVRNNGIRFWCSLFRGFANFSEMIVRNLHMCVCECVHACCSNEWPQVKLRVNLVTSNKNRCVWPANSIQLHISIEYC